MNIKIGICDKDHRYANKAVKWMKDADGHDIFETVVLKHMCSDTKPVLKLPRAVINPQVYNYIKLYWGNSNQEYTEDGIKMAKCYYVRDRDYDGQCYYLNCEEDVLYTFKNDIYNLECNVLRQEFKSGQYIPDERVLASVKRKLEQYNASTTAFSTAGTGNPVVLTVSGGNS